MPTMPAQHPAPYRIENPEAAGRVVVVCEHAANDFPAPWGDLGLDDAARRAHVAWDPGALGVARGLARLLDGVLLHGTVSRLIYDLNRPPHAPGAMAEVSEVYTIPGNHALSPQARLARVNALYLPFHDRLRAVLAARLVAGPPPVLLTVHSFTPVFHGQPRAVEYGVIHDADDRLARAIAARPTGLATALNEPYSAADGVAHTLALHATPLGLPHAMLEIRNDLIADADAQAAIAAQLAPAIAAAIEEAA